jgi:UDPglucose 6-dehydrogenase
MGDGGSCHPRDLIALSWLEGQLGTSTNFFESLAVTREQQTEWLADLVRHYAKLTGLQVVILGMSYKPESDLTYGSPALLLRHYLDGVVKYQMDTYVRFGTTEAVEPYVYVIATKHPEFVVHKFWPGSVVIDPFGYIQDQPGVTVIRVGRT